MTELTINGILYAKYSFEYGYLSIYLLKHLPLLDSYESCNEFASIISSIEGIEHTALAFFDTKGKAI